MMHDTIPEKRQPGLEPLDDEVDHVLGYHPHAFAAAAAAEATALQGRFWDMHEPLFHRQRALNDSGMASGEVRGTPTPFIDGAVHRGGYDAATLTEALVG
jgi:Na+:H+ antiporter, NhaA family